MFVIWGETTSEKDRGVVADKCVVCGEVATLRVRELFRKSHVYHIPLGAGTRVGETVTCTRCGVAASGGGGGYTAFLPEKQARGMSLGEVIEKTNPRLAEEIAYKVRLEREAREGGRAPGGPDPRVRLAFARLGDLPRRSPEVHDIQARLSEWGTLDAAPRERLLREVDDLAARHEKAEAVHYLVTQMAHKFKPDVDAFLSVLVFVVVAVGGGVWAGESLNGTGAWIGGATAVVAAVGLSAALHEGRKRAGHMKFFRRVLLPEADAKGVTPAEVLARLEAVTPADEKNVPNLRALATARPLLLEVLAEQGAVAELGAG